MKRMSIIEIEYLSSATFDIETRRFVVNNAKNALLDIIKNDSPAYGTTGTMSICSIRIYESVEVRDGGNAEG